MEKTCDQCGKFFYHLVECDQCGNFIRRCFQCDFQKHNGPFGHHFRNVLVHEGPKFCLPPLWRAVLVNLDVQDVENLSTVDKENLETDQFRATKLISLKTNNPGDYSIYIPCEAVCDCGKTDWMASEPKGYITIVGLKFCREVHRVDFTCYGCGRQLPGTSPRAYCSKLFFPGSLTKVNYVYERTLLETMCAMRAGDAGFSANAMLEGLIRTTWTNVEFLPEMRKDILKCASQVDVRSFRATFLNYRIIKNEIKKMKGFTDDLCLACTGPHGCQGVHTDGQFKTSCYQGLGQKKDDRHDYLQIN